MRRKTKKASPSLLETSNPSPYMIQKALSSVFDAHPPKPIDVDNISLIVEEISGATGLRQVRTDPGEPFVYAGFAGLLVTSFLSLLSHSQVWGAQKKVDGTSVLYVGGTSNRGKEESSFTRSPRRVTRVRLKFHSSKTLLLV